MKIESANWLKNYSHKLVVILLVVVILVLGSSYVVLKRENENIIRAVSQQQQAQQQPEIIEPPKVVEEVSIPDTIPPKIENYCFGILDKNEERVCIKIDSWNGYLDAVNSVPITGKIEGDVKSVTVDGKNITWDENKEIYQRLNLYIYGGLNKYKVVAEDMNGNRSTGYVETDAQNNDNSLNINLNE